jgi:hypothetical protein
MRGGSEAPGFFSSSSSTGLLVTGFMSAIMGNLKSDRNQPRRNTCCTSVPCSPILFHFASSLHLKLRETGQLSAVALKTSIT